AYCMFDRHEFLAFHGYHPECRYYPHPEGYLPLKYLMFGRQPWGYPRGYHFHSLYRAKDAQGVRMKWNIPIGEDTYDLVGNDHVICNAMICAYTLGGEKWLQILYDNWHKKLRSKWLLNGIRDYAREVSRPEYEWVQRNKLYSLDEVLIKARKEEWKGMENWNPEIGDDPLD
ncbi:MAG: hypothetical protein KAJ19_22715, partial [Gammaproteobacteria bacterium]|nr:hypothetical protein [Gammaproteobacteria bacterium]